MIPFVREFEFEYGHAAQVSPLIRRVVARNPGPFTFTGTGPPIALPFLDKIAALSRLGRALRQLVTE